MANKNSPLAGAFPQPASAQAVDVPLDVSPRAALSVTSSNPVRGQPESVILLDPWDVTIPETPNRADDAFTTERFEQLRASIVASGGNVEPIKVLLVQESPRRYELVFGERRLRACRDARVQVLAIVARPADGLEDYLDRIRENLAGEDLAACEFAKQVGHVLAQPNPPKHAELALRLGISASQISRAWQLYNLPSELIAAFASPRDIRYEDVKPLRDAWRGSPELVAREIAVIRSEEERATGPEVVRRLAAAAKPLKEELASCKSPAVATQPQAMLCAERPVGEWHVDAQGALAVRIDAAMSEAQREAMLEQVLGFLQKRVLKRPKPSSQEGAAVGRAADEKLAGEEAA